MPIINLEKIFGGKEITYQTPSPQDFNTPNDVIALCWHNGYFFQKDHVMVSNAYKQQENIQTAFIIGDNIYYTGSVKIHIQKK